MEEKKLTDEEILNDLQLFSNLEIEEAKKQGAEKAVLLATLTLDLIHRLQVENKRLTEERDVYLDDCSAVRHKLRQEIEEKFELQKQVDELKKENERLKKFEMYRIKAMKEDKDEIERLTADLISMDREQEGYIATIKDLNKQIDEFVKIARVSDTKKIADGIKEQAVKDTAKEIFEKMLFEFRHYGKNEKLTKPQVLGTLEKIVKSKGVEVE